MTILTVADESSLRYLAGAWSCVLSGWQLFIFGFGLYGHAVYLAELQRLHGWSTGLISMRARCRPARLAAGRVYNDAMSGSGQALSAVRIFGSCSIHDVLAFAETPWQLYAAYILLACGWMGMGTGGDRNHRQSWFDRRRGLAISIAFNGATCGGIIIAPTLVVLIGAIGSPGDADNDRCDDFHSGPCRDRIDRCFPGNQYQIRASRVCRRYRAGSCCDISDSGLSRRRLPSHCCAGRFHRASDRLLEPTIGRALAALASR